jgi:hypothetical protein
MRSCAGIARTRAPSATRQIRTVLSAPPLASHFASGLNATVQTASVWPTSVRTRAPSAQRQIRTALS